MTTAERFSLFISYFSEHGQNAETELRYTNPFELLVAVVLSAQCTDKRVNMVTPALFHDFPNAQSLANVTFDDLLPYISSISFPNNKTKNLIGLGKVLIEKYGGNVPDNVEDLVTIPGVGRKTANVITSVIFDKPAIAVDTHVYRVSKRLGLASNMANTPLSVEKELVSHIPETHLAKSHHWLILHGRYICIARKPKCETCPLTGFCAYYEAKSKGLEFHIEPLSKRKAYKKPI